MPSVKASLEFLQRLPLYEVEKPYWCFVSPQSGIDPDQERQDNLEFEHHSDIVINDIRDRINDYKIGDCGFEVLSHETNITDFKTEDNIEDYRKETEDLLKETLGAVYVQ
jgi:hypothetical protein